MVLRREVVTRLVDTAVQVEELSHALERHQYTTELFERLRDRKPSGWRPTLADWLEYDLVLYVGLTMGGVYLGTYKGDP
jgi:hypothetical protein